MSNGQIHASGELRQSQLISTFGPGAMLDLPNQSVLVGGLDYWRGEMRCIYEERLRAKVCEYLEKTEIDLRQPPIADSSIEKPTAGISVFVFPCWFLAQTEDIYETGGQRYRSRPLIPESQLVKNKYLNENKKKISVVPVRFVRACIKGHIWDLNWYDFVHEEFNTQKRGILWLDEGSAGSDLSDIFVRCEFESKVIRRRLSDATIHGLLGKCTGKSPWLGPRVSELCKEKSRLLIRSASNAYFAQTVSVISIPDEEEKLKKAVDSVYEDYLESSENAEDIKRERKKPKVFNALEGYSDQKIWEEVSRRKEKQIPESKSIKQLEIETLLSQPEEIGEDVPEGDFYARALSLHKISPRLTKRVKRLIMVHRLREVVAQIGFTRFEAALPDIDGELSLNVTLAPLARDISWIPTIENKGEGIFIAFEEQEIQKWLEKPAVKERGTQLLEGFNEWCARKELDGLDFPGLPYVMLHSLSHFLISTFSLECGYAASAIRERIYAGKSGHGILLYTGSTGSEGTLGGLVQIGHHLEEHLERALEFGRLCSNDPICSQHHPAHHQEERYLHGAACHGCLLIAETSCERRNEFLDRALVVSTVDVNGAEFFSDEDI